jgi:hypothetical protein
MTAGKQELKMLNDLGRSKGSKLGDTNKIYKR